ncbi:ATP-dependent DNA helicase [Reinekea sp.]
MSVITKRPAFKINVRALADFCQTSGDLISQYRASPSSIEGQFSHRYIQQKRSSPYQPEVSVRLDWQASEFDLSVNGRVDGITEQGIEEIKTSRIPPSEIPETAKALNLSQAKLYAGMIATRNPNQELFKVSVCYVHPQTLQEWPEVSWLSTAELIDYLVECCTRYSDWLALKVKHNRALIPWLNNLNFPFGEMRPEQRLMAESVYKSSVTKRHLAVEAPTGTGKTLAALYPALKAMGSQPIDSIFYLSMKTTGQEAAWSSVALADTEAAINAVQLSAKDTYCLSKETPCDGQYCKFANQYFEKRSNLRVHLFDPVHWTGQAITEFGKTHEICPYYLSQDWAIWADLIIGDLNYIYDTTAVQPYLLKEIDNRATVLIDEAHNLIDRGRMIYSTDFNGEALHKLRQQCPKRIKKTLSKIQTALRNCCKDKHLMIDSEPPLALIQQARQFVSDSAALLREEPSFEPPIEWQQFIFLCSRFVRLSELANERDFIWRYHDGKTHERKVELLCLNPASLLEEKHNLVNNVVAFSATLKPAAYSLTLNGLTSAVFQTLPSPFLPSQHRVRIIDDVSTRFSDRLALPELIRPLLHSYCHNKKNTWVFFSSYMQLNNCVKSLRLNSERHIVQNPHWSSDDKAQLLTRFRNERGITLFCVLGGVFSEGIDLPGEQLEQVVIIGPGLPQVNDINNRIKDSLSQQGLPGFDYTYMYPGLQKVLQAAGRTVRTHSDIGEIILVDDRFKTYWQQGLLPSYWQVRLCSIKDWTDTTAAP